MEDNKFGTVFADGKILNLDSASIEEVEKCLDNVEKTKKVADNKLSELYFEIRNG